MGTGIWEEGGNRPVERDAFSACRLEGESCKGSNPHEVSALTLQISGATTRAK